VPDLLLSFPATAEHVGRVRAAVAGYASRFVEPDALVSVVAATGEAGVELVENAAAGAALVVEVRWAGDDLLVILRRDGGGATVRRSLGARLLDALADRVERAEGPEGAEIMLTFRTTHTHAEGRAGSTPAARRR
jgi:hypothetical protein